MLPKLKNYLDDSENWNSFAFFKTKLLEMIYEYVRIEMFVRGFIKVPKTGDLILNTFG